MTRARIITVPHPDGAWEFAHLVGRILFSVDTAVGYCTCCGEPRLAVRYGHPREEWWHADDAHFAETKHIHVDSWSSDCDGRYAHGHVYRLNSGIAKWALRPSRALKGCEDEEPTWHDLVNYVFTDVSIWSGPTSVEIDTAAGYMRWSTTTDEGGSAGEARICSDPGCAYDEDLYRDHTAVRAGY